MPILATERPVFQQAMRIITDITNSDPAIVTTSFAHQYITGMIVRLNIPPEFGMQEVNQMYAAIAVIDTVTFAINIDTSLFSAFSVPGNFPFSVQSAQCTPVGEISSILTSATRNVLPYNG